MKVCTGGQMRMPQNTSAAPYVNEGEKPFCYHDKEERIWKL